MAKCMLGATSAIALLGVTNLFVVGIREDQLSPWNNALLSSTVTRWTVMESLGIAIDVCLVGWAIYIVAGLQMQISAKTRVVSGFASRLPVLAATILRLTYLKKTKGSDDETFDIVLPEILAQLQMHFLLVAATLPSLQVFLKSFKTGYWDMNVGSNKSPALDSRMATKGNSYAMSVMQSQSTSDKPDRDSKTLKKLQAPGRGFTTSQVVHEDCESMQSENSDRGILIKQTVNVLHS
ncbi:hypothetical protein KC318_g568 [Hortaea werneckii]|nr:hypothetical protein KC334_g655 [Hortaea werneckii]KAI7025402.1 hypothetical protein KC355_g1041 [Hortaea werneckii]KAI7675976.1 hypothetical protein KC318_g568 [Hortaea werneckii]